MKISVLMMAAAVLVSGARFTEAETWNISGSGSWNDPGSWDPASIPNAVGATAIFNSASGPNRTVSTDLAGIKVGTISYNATDAITQTTSVTAGTGGSLILDNGGSGVTVTTSGTGTGNFTISAPITFNDNVTANVNQTAATSASGSLNLTATITGTGGFTKNGSGMMTFGTNDKLYSGPTVLNNGWLRMSYSGRTQNTSSFTINGNALLELINPQSPGTVGDYTLGPGSLNLNGFGFATAGGPQGVIRPQRTNVVGGRQNIINNPVTLQSDSLVHVQSFAFAGSNNGVDDLSHSLTFTGVISGTSALYQTAVDSNQELGRVILSGANTYSGGTFVRGGRMEVSGANATFGAGNVTLLNPALALTNPAGIAGAIASLVIPAGVNNAIADAATVTLAGSNRTFAELATGVDELVGSITLGATTFTAAGTYGSSVSGANFQFDDFFVGGGVLRIADTGLAGDYNGDGVVDNADYVVWRKNPDDFGGDPGGYNTWRMNFGESQIGSGGNSDAVPEPTTLVLLGLLAPAALAARRFRT